MKAITREQKNWKDKRIVKPQRLAIHIKKSKPGMVNAYVQHRTWSFNSKKEGVS